jgi:hypothetical protein
MAVGRYRKTLGFAPTNHAYLVRDVVHRHLFGCQLASKVLKFRNNKCGHGLSIFLGLSLGTKRYFSDIDVFRLIENVGYGTGHGLR